MEEQELFENRNNVGISKEKEELGLRKGNSNILTIDDTNDEFSISTFEIRMDGYQFFPMDGFDIPDAGHIGMKSSKNFGNDQASLDEMSKPTLKSLFDFKKKISNHFYMSKFSCDCLDFLRKKTICMHIFFGICCEGVYGQLLSNSKRNDLLENMDVNFKNCMKFSKEYRRQRSKIKLAGISGESDSILDRASNVYLGHKNDITIKSALQGESTGDNTLTMDLNNYDTQYKKISVILRRVTIIKKKFQALHVV